MFFAPFFDLASKFLDETSWFTSSSISWMFSSKSNSSILGDFGDVFFLSMGVKFEGFGLVCFIWLSDFLKIMKNIENYEKIAKFMKYEKKKNMKNM